MDMQSIWKEGSDTDKDLARMFEKGSLHKLSSRLPLKKLRNNLLAGLLAAVILTVGYILLLFRVSIWQVQVALVVGILFNTIVMLQGWKLYRSTPQTVSSTNSLKQELLLHYHSFQRWWSIQEKMGLFVYPIAATGGFILGGVEGSGKTVEAFLYNPKMLMVLAIALLILVPLCYWMARWMYNLSYGKHLKKLKLLIEGLNSEDALL